MEGERKGVREGGREGGRKWTYEHNQPVVHIRRVSPTLNVITSKQRPRKLVIQGERKRERGREGGRKGWKKGWKEKGREGERRKRRE